MVAPSHIFFPLFHANLCPPRSYHAACTDVQVEYLVEVMARRARKAYVSFREKWVSAGESAQRDRFALKLK